MGMIDVTLIDGPITQPLDRPAKNDAGAWLVFEGVVRELEDDATIRGLTYQIYEPMTRKELQQLAQETLNAHDIQSILVMHSVGFVAVGQCSFRLAIQSAHRKAAIQAMDTFIDVMKKRVPIWKLPVN